MMKNSKGSISLSGIIILLLALIMVMAGTKTILNRYTLLSLKNKSNELRRDLNNSILLAVYEETYFKESLNQLANQYRRGHFIGLDGSLKIRDGIKTQLVNWETEGTVDTNRINFSARNQKNGLSALVKYTFTRVNPIFLSKNPVDLQEDEIEFIDKNIVAKYGEKEYYNKNLEYFIGETGGYSLENLDTHPTIEGFHEKKSFNSRQLYLIIKNENEKSRLTVDKVKLYDDEVLYKPLYLNGVIYIDGDLFVKNEFDFRGILIVNGDIKVEAGSKLSVEGFLKSSSISGDYSYIYDKTVVFKDYGSYIPGFIHFKLENIRSEK